MHHLFLGHAQKRIEVVETVNGRFLDEQRLSSRLIIQRSGVDDISNKRHIAFHELGLGLLKASRIALQ